MNNILILVYKTSSAKITGYGVESFDQIEIKMENY